MVTKNLNSQLANVGEIETPQLSAVGADFPVTAYQCTIHHCA